MSIGQQLREERIRQGVSVRRMAELTNTTPATVQNVESNAHSPSVEIVQRMAEVLGCRLTIEREA